MVKKILEIIESVSIDDTDMLDEIDARVWCWLTKDADFKNKNEDGEWTFDSVGKHNTFTAIAPDHKELEAVGLIKYTRSRDVLKAIRPDGWLMNIEPRFGCTLLNGKDGFYVRNM